MDMGEEMRQCIDRGGPTCICHPSTSATVGTQPRNQPKLLSSHPRSKGCCVEGVGARQSARKDLPCMKTDSGSEKGGGKRKERNC